MQFYRLRVKSTCIPTKIHCRERTEIFLERSVTCPIYRGDATRSALSVDPVPHDYGVNRVSLSRTSVIRAVPSGGQARGAGRGPRAAADPDRAG